MPKHRRPAFSEKTKTVDNSVSRPRNGNYRTIGRGAHILFSAFWQHTVFFAVFSYTVALQCSSHTVSFFVIGPGQSFTVESIDNCSRIIARLNEVHIRWVPAHHGAPGNEKPTSLPGQQCQEIVQTMKLQMNSASRQASHM